MQAHPSSSKHFNLHSAHSKQLSVFRNHRYRVYLRSAAKLHLNFVSNPVVMINYPSKTVYAAPGRFSGVASITDGQFERGSFERKSKQVKSKREERGENKSV